RRLFATGKIDDARAQVTKAPEGLVLSYVVAERPAIARVRFEGAQAMGQAELMDALHAQDLEVLDPARVKHGIEGRRSEYADRGYLHARATTRTESAGEGVVLVVAVEEGPEVRVSSLTFEGSKTLSPETLRKLVATKVGEPYRVSLFERDLLVAGSAYLDR